MTKDSDSEVNPSTADHDNNGGANINDGEQQSMLKSKKPKKKKSKNPVIVPASGQDSGTGRVSVVVPQSQGKKLPVNDDDTQTLELVDQKGLRQL